MSQKSAKSEDCVLGIYWPFQGEADRSLFHMCAAPSICIFKNLETLETSTMALIEGQYKVEDLVLAANNAVKIKTAGSKLLGDKEDVVVAPRFHLSGTYQVTR